MVRSAVIAAVLFLAALPAGAQQSSGFPVIRNVASVKINLTRGNCFGPPCPAYTVEVDGDGTVTFDGGTIPKPFPAAMPLRPEYHGVVVSGRHRTKISPKGVAALIDAFLQADFFGLQDSYSASISDQRTYLLGISFDGHKKEIVDYAGNWAGMPAAVTALENRVDEIAGTDKWVKGNAETLPALTAEGWDFKTHGEANLRLLSTGVVNINLIVALLAAGVPTDSDYGCVALDKAVKGRNYAAAYLLASAHAPFVTETAREYEGRRCDVLGTAVDRGNLESVAWLLRHGADASEHDRQGTSLLMRAKGSADMALLLLSDGADPNARDAKGQTALMQASAWPDVARLLLEHGADADIKDVNGKTAFDLYPASGPSASVLADWRQRHPK